MEKKFNENSVDDFIRQLRVTAEYAKVYAPEFQDPVPTLEPEYLPAVELQVQPAPQPAPFEQIDTPSSPAALRSNVYLPPPNTSDIRQDTFSLDEGQVVLQWPAKLSANSYEDLKDWMDLQLRKIKRNVSGDYPSRS